MKHWWIGTAAIVGLGWSAGIAAGAVVDFESGPMGWSVNGFDEITPVGGNPGGHINHVQTDTFGISVRNNTNPDFLGDFTARGDTRLTIDFDVNFIRFFGGDVPRDIVLELRDYDNPSEGYPYVSVWYNAGALPAPDEGWQTFTFDITNVLGSALPAGWGGFGAEDPETFEPILPPDRTWTSVLAGVDEIVFTTFVPGFFYGFTDYDVKVDNITIAPVPGAGTASALLLGAAVSLRRRRGA